MNDSEYKQLLDEFNRMRGSTVGEEKPVISAKSVEEQERENLRRLGITPNDAAESSWAVGKRPVWRDPRSYVQRVYEDRTNQCPMTDEEFEKAKRDFQRAQGH
jgi:hypothetical protein